MYIQHLPFLVCTGQKQAALVLTETARVSFREVIRPACSPSNMKDIHFRQIPLKDQPAILDTIGHRHRAPPAEVKLNLQPCTTCIHATVWKLNHFRELLYNLLLARI